MRGYRYLLAFILCFGCLVSPSFAQSWSVAWPSSIMCPDQDVYVTVVRGSSQTNCYLFSWENPTYLTFPDGNAIPNGVQGDTYQIRVHLKYANLADVSMRVDWAGGTLALTWAQIKSTGCYTTPPPPPPPTPAPPPPPPVYGGYGEDFMANFWSGINSVFVVVLPVAALCLVLWLAWRWLARVLKSGGGSGGSSMSVGGSVVRIGRRRPR